MFHTSRYGTGVTISIALAVLALVHAHWALGGHWPEKDPGRLAELVVGTRGPMPSPLACWVVAGLLAGAALLTLGASGWLSLPFPGWFVEIAAWCVVVVFTLRGLGGFFDARLRPGIRGLPYHRWNLVLYSPLCLILAAWGAWSIAG